MAYCAYLRKSRADTEAEARGAGETLARHEAELLQLAARQNIILTAIYKELVSGETIASRPQMQRLLAEVEAGKWEGVLVVEITRLARGDTIDQGIVAQAFKYSNTKIITPTKTYDPANEFDEEYFEFGLFMSRREYKMINQRQQRGRLAAVQEGKFVGNKAPYGYRRIRLEKQKGWTLEPDENAPNVQLIFDLFTQKGLGCTKICRRLNQLRIPTATGKPWTDCVVRGIITSPIYAGWIRWGHRPVQKTAANGTIQKSRPRAAAENVIITKGLHPPLVSQQQFDKAQKMLAANRSTREHESLPLQNPLAGLVICSHCGKAMLRRPGGKNDNRPTMLMCFTQDCPTVGSVLEKAEAALLESMRQWLRDYKVCEQPQLPAAEDVSLLQKTLAAAQKDLETLDHQMARIHQLLEQDIYTIDVFLARSADVAHQQDELKKQIASLRDELALKKKLTQAHTVLIPKIQNVLDAYPAAKTAEEKNRLLRSVLQKVDYSKTTRQSRKNRSDDLQLTIYPRQPEEMV